MINQLVLEGRLTRDAELKYTPKGTSMLTFTIANNSGYGDYEKTLFLNCVIFGKRAEGLHQYLGKGQYVVIQGVLTQDKWQDRDGNNRVSFNCMINELSLVPTGNRKRATEQRTTEKFNDTTTEEFDDDDIPF